MIILSFDTASTTGWCVFSTNKKKPIMWGKFNIYKSKEDNIPQSIGMAGARFIKFKRNIEFLLNLYKPTFVVAENLTVFHKSTRTVMYLSTLLGILALSVKEKLNIDLSLYNPMTGRVAVLGKGNGHAEKWVVLKELNKKYDYIRIGEANENVRWFNKYVKWDNNSFNLQSSKVL